MSSKIADNIVLHDQAILAYRGGRYAEAEALFRQSLVVRADDVAVLASYGEFLRGQGRPFEALEVFERILSFDPDNADVLNAAGVCYQETANPSRAIEYYLRAMALKPDMAVTWNNIGVVLLHEGDDNAALDHFYQALALDPNYADACCNLAVAYRQRLDYTNATEAFRRAYQLEPNSAEIAAGLGEILGLLYEDAAEGILRRAVALDPKKAERHWNLSLELLKRGKYTEGWREYEWRFQRGKGHNPPRPFAQPAWRGEAWQDLRGKTLLLHAEQGLGDTLQMLRYLPMVLERGAKVVLEVQRPLHRLVAEYAARSHAGVEVVTAGDALPAFDLHTPLMTLPHALGTTLETVPSPIRLTPAAEPLTTAGELRIGLCWAGNPGHDRDRERSVPLELLKPLFEIAGTQWVSLQVGPAAREIDTCGVKIAQPVLNDFADTTALLDTLDLVIAVDTAVAHLAATQGVPTWILLPYVADWRWLRPGAARTSWYPEARLFRQSSRPTGTDPYAHWPPVIAEVVEALQEKLPAR